MEQVISSVLDGERVSYNRSKSFEKRRKIGPIDDKVIFGKGFQPNS